jgi:hypothetical protein
MVTLFSRFVLFIIHEAGAQRALCLRPARKGLAYFIFRRTFLMKKFIYVMTAALSVSLFLIGLTGCPTEADAGVQGPAGSQGAIYLSGPQTSAGIQDAIDSGAPLVFAGVTQSDTGQVIIPAGRGVRLVGGDAFKLANNTAAILVIVDDSSVTGEGTIITQSSGMVIAPQTVLDDKITGSATLLAYQASGGGITFANGFAAVAGDVTIKDGSNGSIAASVLTGKTLIVTGNVSVEAALAGAATISVLGNVVIKTAQTQAVVWQIMGDLDAQEVPTAGAGSIKMMGNAVFAKALTTSTGTVNIDGNAEFKDTLTTGAGTNSKAVSIGGNATFAKAVSLGGNLSVNGTAEFKSTLTNTTAAIAAFNGTTTITGAVTVGTGGLTIAGKGMITLEAAPVVAASKILTVNTKSGAANKEMTGMVILNKGINVGTVAGGLTIAGEGAVALLSGQAIAFGSGGTVKGGQWSIGTVAGTATATGPGGGGIEDGIGLLAEGIYGMPGAKLSLAGSGITVGLSTGDDGQEARIYGVDIYLASGNAAVTVQSGASNTNATTLTLDGGAKISGLTGTGATGTADVTAIAGTSDAKGGITNIIAVTGTASSAAANNYLGIKADEDEGTITATASSGAKKYVISTTSKASAAGT